MTTGQLLFYGGAALLGLTIILAIIFLIKRPKYTPESAAYDVSYPERTQSLRNGYPTERVTIRRDRPQQAMPVEDLEETELLPDAPTELITEVETSDPQQTELMDQGTVKTGAGER